MKTVATFLFSFFFFVASSQTWNYDYFPGLEFQNKQKCASQLVQVAEEYVRGNVDNIQATLRKQKKIKLNKAARMDAFVANMKDDLLNRLMDANEWDESHMRLWDTYRFSIETLLGRKAIIPGMGKPYSETFKNASASVSYEGNHFKSLNIYLYTYAHLNSRYNGIPYTSENLAVTDKKVQTTYGSQYSKKTEQSSTAICSAYDTEPVYIVKYEFQSKTNFLTISTTYGPYAQSIGNGQCRWLGNQLTAVRLFLYSTL
jgi:hypothetical protein